MAATENVLPRLGFVVAMLVVPNVRLAEAQESIGQGPFFDQIFMNMVLVQQDPRGAANKCAALLEPLKSLEGVSEPHRLYLESEIEHCIYLAMNQGEFSDGTGDQCSHHYASATKFAAAMDGWIKEPNAGGHDMAKFADNLEIVVRNGELMGCKGDYSVLAATLAAARAAH